jgi:hypothetical protein
MPLSDLMFNQAKTLIQSTSTQSLAEFKKALSDAGLECIDSNNDGIEWWTAGAVQKKELLSLVKDGSAKGECVKLLSDYTLRAPVDSKVVQPFVTDEFNRSGWFQYYYSEASAVKNEMPGPQKTLLETITNVFFYTQSKSGQPGTYGMKLPFDSVPDDLFRGVLYELMTMGFKKIPAHRKQAIAGNSLDVALVGKLLWAGNPDKVQGSEVKVIPVECKWRGDSRPYHEVRDANGFTTKAASDAYAIAKNLSANWHPMSTDLGRAWLWFRKNQKDNCLYSVVSVGKTSDWKTYLAYPLIKLSGGVVNKMRGYLGTRKVKCIPAGGGAAVLLDLPVSETYLYLFVVAGLALDTGAMQGKSEYPEIGVGKIPLKNVFGTIRFVRVHLGDVDTVTDDDGVICMPSGVTLNDDTPTSIQCSYGQVFWDKMNMQFKKASEKGYTAIKWSPSGAGYAELSVFDKVFKFNKSQYKIQMPLDVSTR